MGAYTPFPAVRGADRRSEGREGHPECCGGESASGQTAVRPSPPKSLLHLRRYPASCGAASGREVAAGRVWGPGLKTSRGLLRRPSASHPGVNQEINLRRRRGPSRREPTGPQERSGGALQRPRPGRRRPAGHPAGSGDWGFPSVPPPPDGARFLPGWGDLGAEGRLPWDRKSETPSGGAALGSRRDAEGRARLRGDPASGRVWLVRDGASCGPDVLPGPAKAPQAAPWSGAGGRSVRVAAWGGPLPCPVGGVRRAALSCARRRRGVPEQPPPVRGDPARCLRPRGLSRPAGRGCGPASSPCPARAASVSASAGSPCGRGSERPPSSRDTPPRASPVPGLADACAVSPRPAGAVRDAARQPRTAARSHVPPPRPSSPGCRRSGTRATGRDLLSQTSVRASRERSLCGGRAEAGGRGRPRPSEQGVPCGLRRRTPGARPEPTADAAPTSPGAPERDLLLRYSVSTDGGWSGTDYRSPPAPPPPTFRDAAAVRGGGLVALGCAGAGRGASRGGGAAVTPRHRAWAPPARAARGLPAGQTAAPCTGPLRGGARSRSRAHGAHCRTAAERSRRGPAARPRPRRPARQEPRVHWPTARRPGPIVRGRRPSAQWERGGRGCRRVRTGPTAAPPPSDRGPCAVCAPGRRWKPGRTLASRRPAGAPLPGVGARSPVVGPGRADPPPRTGKRKRRVAAASSPGGRPRAAQRGGEAWDGRDGPRGVLGGIWPRICETKASPGREAAAAGPRQGGLASPSPAPASPRLPLPQPRSPVERLWENFR
ncbi:collagen alpha-1(I) chain-like [Lutra lutra]|uniref:collagen alpha-1(I) chain-like n=1 Tax=Lutra lutra TaxID=9657 RepID=UPI001FD35D7E|nr:collagen alpha-1(I) chain-like [Lutra lutra]